MRVREGFIQSTFDRPKQMNDDDGLSERRCSCGGISSARLSYAQSATFQVGLREHFGIEYLEGQYDGVPV